jgi:parallel beta-helix repeat protein
MKKSKVAFLLFLCVISLCVVTAQPVKSQSLGAVYILSDGTVQSSINATVPIQQDGDVYTFTDNLIVTTFVVQRSGVTIDGAGFALEGEGQIGIDLSSVNTVTIENVQLNGKFFFGIYISESSYNTVTGCTIASNGNGISLYSSIQNTITGNIIIGNDIGLDLMESSDNVFRNNRLDNTHNIAVYGAELSHFIHDMDDSNTISDDKKVYYFVDKENLVITPDTFPDVGFLALVSCTNITVYDITLTKNVQGVLLVSTTGSTIAQCEITYNYAGIMLFASSSNVFSENIITNNNRGIQFSMLSTANRIFSNNIADNRGGIFLFNSSQNIITDNNITNNDNYGIGLSSSSYNLIRSNYFTRNGIQVYDASTGDSSVTASMNTWHVTYPVGGNYWSDYTGVDVKSGSNQDQEGSDKIGDTPYIIDNNNKDYYPLMPYGSPPAISIVSPGNKTYTVTSVSLTFTVSETTSWIKYSLDGQANVTITGSTTLSGLADGLHNITVYAQDTDGLTGTSETIYFTIAEGAETPQSESFPITWIAAIIVVVAIVGVAFLYFLKIEKK